MHTHTQKNVKKEKYRSGKMEEIYVMEVMEELYKPSVNHVGRNIGCCIINIGCCIINGGKSNKKFKFGGI